MDIKKAVVGFIWMRKMVEKKTEYSYPLIIRDLFHKLGNCCTLFPDL
jgi:hypothetical protein